MNPSIASSEKKVGKLPSGKKGNLPATEKVRKTLLFCGILSSLLYVAMNVIGAMLYEGYNSASQVVSELSAVDAPTRLLWVLMGIVYTLLLAGFGWGIRQSAGGNRALRVVGALFLVYGVIGLFWPPMHQREVLAAGGATFTDTLHIVFAMVWGFFAVLSIGFGAAAFGKYFRLYSIATLLILVFFGVLTGLEAPQMEANQPTPYIGIWERINIGVYLLWVVVLAIKLLGHYNKTASIATQTKVK